DNGAWDGKQPHPFRRWPMEQRTDTKQPEQNKRTVFRRAVILLLAVAVLVVLVLSLFIKTVNGGLQTVTAADLRKLAAAVDQFQSHWKVSHIPSRIKLCKYLCQYDSASPLDKDSLAYLNQVWPRLMWRRPGAGPEQVTYLRIDWDGIEGPGPAELVLKPDAPPPQEPAPVTLEGDQCLVFFLGGIPATVNGVADCTGFSRNLHNPAAAAGERI